MTIRKIFDALAANERLNFALTNRLPRRAVSRLMGRVATAENRLVSAPAIAAFRFFCAPDLSEARKSEFRSLRDCFIRELAPGRRPVDRRPDTLVSPSDGIVVAAGTVASGQMLQVKGSTYALAELLRDAEGAAALEGGSYATLRLTAGMYHRFHAPQDGRLAEVAHVPGDAWNVNPPALARIPRLYCRNERAILRFELSAGGPSVTLVAVAAILVAGIRIHGVSLPGGRAPRAPWRIACDLTRAKGEELGWFEHGSTIVVLAPRGVSLDPGVREGLTTRMGAALMRLPG
ncbi:MAG: archaetidylserine decarboxylase [Rhodospirillales bacterium]